MAAGESGDRLDRRYAIKAAQMVLSDFRPMKVDGVWGPTTEAVYVSAPPTIRESADLAAASIGWDLVELRRELAVSGVAATAGKVDVQQVIERAKRAGITGRSLSNFLATVEVESGFVPRHENHRYSPARARKMFRTLRDRTDSEIAGLVEEGADAFFNFVYHPNTTIGEQLGNREADDGARFRGAGLIQLTGRANFASFSRWSGVDAVSNPSYLLTPRGAIDSAVWFWATRVAKNGADMVAATKVVNRYLPEDEVNARVGVAARYANVMA